MQGSEVRITNIPERKLKRMEAKKRKVSAFLDLVTSKDNYRTHKKNSTKKSVFHVELNENLNGENDEETSKKETTLKELREQLRTYQCSVEKKPTIYLTNMGVLSRYIIEPGVKPQSDPIISITLEDIRNLMLLSTLARDAFVKTRFCTMYNYSQIQTVVLLVIEGISCEDYIPFKDDFKRIGNTFKEGVKVSILECFFRELFWESARDDVSTIQADDDADEEKICNRVNLLLSPIQMMFEGYPMPNSTGDFEGFKYTKENYEPVHGNSPMFALDCEMVETESDRRALARVAIVDENFNVVYDSYVVPPTRITNYLTEFSGITKQIMQGVTKTLEDAQNDIKLLLPKDAILCGQSLNFDLICLKLFHPYIIDTSSIYNLSCNPGQKQKLKYLANYFLNEDIQNDFVNGHNPQEDCVAVMKLVSLKLKNRRTFGDTSLGWVMPNNGKTKKPLSPNLLDRLSDKNKKVCIVSDRKVSKKYRKQSIASSESIKKIICKDVKSRTEMIMSRLWQDDFVIGHFRGSLEDIESVDEIVCDIFNGAPDKTLVNVILAGEMGKNDATGLFMTAVKNVDRV